MKLKLPLLMISTVVFCALLVYAENPQSIQQEVSSFSSQSVQPDFIPVVEIDLSDLEARDINNQPIKNNFARKQLRTLFSDNLLSLLVYTEIQSIASSLTAIRHKLNLGAFSFERNLPVLILTIIDVFFQSTKKFLEKIFNCLSGFLAVVVPAIFAFCALQLATPKMLAPVYLRC